MSLSPGTQIGPYEVTGQLGAGGMGEVYRAVDKTLGLEKSDGLTAIVMELVEGRTLADRIAEGPIPVDEAMDIAMQLINALEAAHHKGIVHRDLKPANIVLKPDGTVSVLDFGIAKAFESLPVPDGSDRPVMTTPVTQTGVILGTAAYMSPEQARSKFVDQRSDIWAFGCVLYEMLTGQSAFGGEDVPITLARVLAQDTNMDSLPAMISPAVRQTLQLCLQRPARRRAATVRSSARRADADSSGGAQRSSERLLLARGELDRRLRRDLPVQNIDRRWPADPDRRIARRHHARCGLGYRRHDFLRDNGPVGFAARLGRGRRARVVDVAGYRGERRPLVAGAAAGRRRSAVYDRFGHRIRFGANCRRAAR